MRCLKIAPDGHEYEIRIQSGILYQLDHQLADLVEGRRVHIVTDETVDFLFGKAACSILEKIASRVGISVLPVGEQEKNLASLSRLYNDFSDLNLTRTDYILALGGGVIGDLAGFAAATYLRGIPLIQVPTTLLSQVDSSVGGKVAVNLPQGKNLVGSFYQPTRVLIDPETLSSLSGRLFSEGMAEVIKYGAIVDKELFETVSRRTRASLMEDIQDIIARCCTIKAGIVMRDPMDKGERMVLNFGHTLGHALEEAAGYGTYYHGEAVSIGMVAAAAYGENHGYTQNGVSERLKGILSFLELPVSPEKRYSLAGSISKDKKMCGREIAFILLKNIGEAFIHRMPYENLINFAEEYAS